MGRKKKYLTEEERLEAKRERNRRWIEKNKEYGKQWYQNNREKELEKHKQYYQEHKKERSEYNKKYRESKRDELLEEKKLYYKENRERFLEKLKEINKTKNGRSKYLCKNYKREDKKYNRGECTLTPQWIVNNTFTSHCIYCGETDWRKLGCDRIDNSKPHTPDNVVPCCTECNKKRGTKPFEEFLKEMQQKRGQRINSSTSFYF